MANNPQTTLAFPGLPPVVGGGWTVSRGVLPSVCLVETLRRPASGGSGTLALSQGGVSTNATGASLADFRPARSPDGRGFRWIARILDRRALWWRWIVEGDHNVRLPDGTVRTDGKMSARELASHLFDGMGETGYDVDDLPDDVYPRAKWDGIAAPLALDRLTRAFGCEVCYDPFANKAGVRAIGSGADLPAGGQLTPSAAFSRGDGPKTLQLVGGPSRFQFLFQLSPVGLETDGSVTGIDNLSYKPAGGWSGEWPTVFAGVAQNRRHLAFQSVFRWYQATAFADGTLAAPNYGTLTRIDQCFPLLPALLETEADDAGVFRSPPPRVEGTFWPESLLAENTAANTPCPIPFRLDRKNGLVKFDRPMIAFSSGSPVAATLFLTAACEIRDADREGFARHDQTRTVNGDGSGTLPFYRKELFSSSITSYLNGEVAETVSNAVELAAESTAWLTARGREHAPLERRCETFRGIRNVAPDGKLAQVRFVWGAGRSAETTVGLGCEFDGQEPSREERLSLAKSLAERFA